MGHIRQSYLAILKRFVDCGAVKRAAAVVVFMVCGVGCGALYAAQPLTDTPGLLHAAASTANLSIINASAPVIGRDIDHIAEDIAAALVGPVQYAMALHESGIAPVGAGRMPLSAEGDRGQSLLFLVIDNPPYLRLKSGELDGRLGKPLDAILRALPSSVHYEAVPVRRALRILLENEQYACSVGVHKAEGEGLVQFTQQLYPSRPLVLMTTSEKADKFLRYDSFTDLFVSGKFIMSRSVSISYGPELDALVRAHPTSSIMATGGLKEQLNLVEHDRSDFVLVTKEEFDYLARAEHLGGGGPESEKSERQQYDTGGHLGVRELANFDPQPVHKQTVHFQKASTGGAQHFDDSGDLRGLSHAEDSLAPTQVATKDWAEQDTLGVVGQYVAISYTDLPHNLPIYMACSKQVPQDIIEAINVRINALNGIQE